MRLFVSFERVFFLKYCFISIFSLFFSIGCVRGSDFDSIRLPQDSAMNEADVYAVVVNPYVTLKDRPGSSGVSIDHARRGNVCRVLGKVFVSDNSRNVLWVQLAGGWLASTCVDLYSSREKALTASKCLE